jgi:NAD(P)H dehydrogenase (quinone)
MSPPIAIVGAAGPTGMAAIRALSARGYVTRALVHSNHQADGVRAAGAAEVSTIELDDPATLASAFDGASAVLHIPPVFNPREGEHTQASADAAATAGIDRFVHHSVMHPFTPDVRHHVRKAHAGAIVRRSGLRWTILEPCMYASTIMFYWGRSPAGTVILPFSLDTPFTPVALADVAEATAIVLSDARHELATYELGGPEVLSGRQMLSLSCRALGEHREIRRGELSELATPVGWCESAQADMAAMCAHYDKVGLAGGSRTLEMLLGRPATRFADALVAAD